MLTKNPGLPPAGNAAIFIGFDENRLPYLLRWNAGEDAWQGVGFDPRREDGRLIGFAFLARGDMADFIVAHAAIEP